MSRRGFQIGVLLALGLLMGAFSFGQQVIAQPEQQQFSYGETVGGRFEDSQQDSWEFSVLPREMFRLYVQRIGGEFFPSIEVIYNGNVVVPDEQTLTSYGQILTFTDGQHSGGTYQVNVLGEVSEFVDKINEYSLTLEYIGQRRSGYDEDLTPLPKNGINDFPELYEGTRRPTATDGNENLNIVVYGQGRIWRPDSRQFRHNWQILSGDYGISLNNAEPINRLIESISFLENGFGLTTIQTTTQTPVQIFIDQSITEFTVVRNTLNLRLANGMHIVTDLYQIQEMQVVDDMVILLTTKGQRMILKGQSFEFTRKGGLQGEGPNVEPINLFKVNGQIITSDLQGWHTLFYDPATPELRVIYSDDVRLLSTVGTIGLFMRGNNLICDEQATLPVTQIDIFVGGDCSKSDWRFEIDPYLMGDFIIEHDKIAIHTLDQRIIDDQVNLADDVLTENGAIYFVRRDNTYRLSLPDHTDIETPAEKPNLTDALPNHPQHMPRFFNNLGQTVFDYEPGFDFLGFTEPYNRINGNFYYAVEDVNLTSHAPSLVWERSYNSLSPDILTPDYYHSSRQPYLFGNVGNRWRHSYQYELDIRYVPAGDVWLILPDGSRHVFRVTDNPNIFRSSRMLSWQIERLDGLTGRWLIRRSNGWSYEFDRAGRLQRIVDSNGLDLTFSLAPGNQVEAETATAGFFVIEHYGRRLEAYKDAAQRVILVRQQYENRYFYDDYGNMTRVIYPSIEDNLPDDAPNYHYNDSHQLVEIQDRLSPYHHAMRLDYADDGRLIEWAEAINSNSILTTQIRYDIRQAEEVILKEDDSNPHITRWLWDTNYRPTEIQYVDANETWTQGFLYDDASALQVNYRHFNRTQTRFRYDAYGYLVEVADAVPNRYALTYQIGRDGVRRLLNEISYPIQGNNTYRERYEYDENERISRVIAPIDGNRSIITRYEYDDLGRVIAIYTPDPVDAEGEVVTMYSYDRFGYINQIEVYPTLRADSARRVLLTEFNNAGRLRKITDWSGVPIAIDWNEERNLITHINYGELSNIAKALEYHYDDLRRLTQQTIQGQDEFFVYDDRNQLETYTDGLGRTTTYRYDVMGNVVEIVEPNSSTSADEQRVIYNDQIYHYRYNAINQLIYSEHPGNIIYYYDYQIAPETGLTTYQVTTPVGERLIYVYDVLGRLQNITNRDRYNRDSYQYRISYSPNGEVVRVEEAHDGSARFLTIDYDYRGNPVKTAIKDAGTQYSYNHAGLISTITTPDGAQTYFTYYDDYIVVTLPDNDNDASTPAPQYTYYYDENENLTTWVDALGYETNYIYDSLNRVVAIQDVLGNVTSYEYDDRDNLTQLTDANELSYSSIYSESDQLVERIMPDGTQTIFTYDNIDRLTQIQSSAYTIKYTYDIQGQVIARDIANRQSLFSYDGLGRISSTTDALGRTTRYFYNNFNRLSQIIDSLGNTRSYLWFRDGRLAFYKDPLDNQYAYISDELGRLSQINLPRQERIRIDYSVGGNLTAIRRLDGNTDHAYRYTYYPNGQIATVSLPSTQNDPPWQMQYDQMGRLTQFIEPNQQATLYEYDALGHITKIHYPDDTVEHYTYDSVGNILTHTTRSNVIHEYRYDNMRRVSEHIQYVDDEEIIYRYRYSEQRPQIIVTDPYQQTQDYHFDEMGNLIQVIYHIRSSDEEDKSRDIKYEYTYDRASNLTSIVFPNVQLEGSDIAPTVNMTYNALNQRVRYVDASANSWAYSYDMLGNLSQISDPLGNSTTYQYDTLRRLTQVQFSNRMAAELIYDTGANSFRLTDNRLEPSARYPVIYEFDLNGNLIKIDPGGSNSNTTTFSYNSMGQMLEMVNANRHRFTYRYDGMGNLIEIQGPDFHSQRSYDTLNNLTQITQNNVSLDFERDPLGRLINYRGQQVNVRYEYDLLGNMTQYERDGVEGSYLYDSLYRMIGSTHNDESVEYIYNDIGWLTAQVYENGLAVYYEYFANARPKSITIHNANAFLLRFEYTYDDFGNVLRLERIDNGARRVVLYSYDGMHQLINEQWLNDNNEVIYGKNYRYDTVGNRIESVTLIPNQAPYRVLYQYNAQNQLITEFRGVPSDTIERDTNAVITDTSQAQRLSYEYDRAGNLIKVNDLNYTYDNLGRLIGVSGTDATGKSVNSRFSYDGAGRVTQVIVGDNPFTLLYDYENLVSVRDENNQITEQFIYDAQGNLLWKQTPDGKFYPITDALGSIRLWVDETGQTIDNKRGYNFGGFGEVIFPYSEANATPIQLQPQLLFAGQLYEPSSNIYIMGVRAYSPEQGRFIQRDPVRHDPQSTLYTYAYNRPTDLFDPLGTTPNPAWNTAFNAPNIPTTNIQPLIFSPVTEESAVNTTTVAQAQAQENNRLLGVVYQLRYMLNDFIFLNDIYRCDAFYLGVKDPSMFIREQAGSSLLNHLNLYNPQHGWANFNPPNPLQKVDVGNILNITNQLVRQAMMNGRILDNQGCDSVVGIPETAFIHPQEAHNIRQQIFEQIQEISLYPMVVNQLDQLTQIPELPLPVAPLPSDTKNAITPVDMAFTGILGMIQSQTQNATFSTMYPLETTNSVAQQYKTYQLLVDIPQVIDATRLDD